MERTKASADKALPVYKVQPNFNRPVNRSVSEDSPSPTSQTQKSKEMDIQGSEENMLNAAKRGDFYKVRELLNKGNDPTIMDDSGLTPLHNAVKKGHSEVAELLIWRGADSEAKDNIGFTPLHHATKYGLEEMVQVLLMHSADPNSRDKRDSTPLHIAARGKNPVVVKMLLDAGADQDAKNKSGMTPHDYAENAIVSRAFFKM